MLEVDFILLKKAFVILSEKWQTLLILKRYNITMRLELEKYIALFQFGLYHLLILDYYVGCVLTNKC